MSSKVRATALAAIFAVYGCASNPSTNPDGNPPGGNTPDGSVPGTDGGGTPDSAGHPHDPDAGNPKPICTRQPYPGP